MKITQQELAAHLYNLVCGQVNTVIQSDDATQHIYDDVAVSGNLDLEDMSAAILDFLG